MNKWNAQKQIKIEFEASIFLKTLELANEVYPFGDLSINHPAHAYLSNVWNTHPKVPTNFKNASIAKIYILLDNEYVSVDDQEPSFQVVDLLQSNVECSAKIGNDILITFFKKPYNLKQSGECWRSRAHLVNGKNGWRFSGTVEDINFGCFEIEGLRKFKNDYPKIYRKLQKKSQITNIFLLKRSLK